VATTVDHIVSRMNEGSDEMGNLQAACSQCNVQKGAAFLEKKAASDARHQENSPLFSLPDQY